MSSALTQKTGDDFYIISYFVIVASVK